MENLRLEARTDPADRALIDPTAELRKAGTEFVLWWDEHRVPQRTHGSQRLRHPVVGDLTVECETLTLPGDPDATLFVHSAEANSPSQ